MNNFASAVQFKFADTVKFADTIDIDVFMQANFNVSAYAYIESDSLVDKLIINMPESSAFDMIMSGVSVIGAHLKHQQLVGKLDLLDKKLNFIMKKLDFISDQLDSIDQKLLQSIRLIENLTELTISTPAANSALKLSGLLKKVQQDMDRWEAGEFLEDAADTRDDIRARVNEIISTEYFQYYQLVAFSIVVLRDISNLLNDGWHPEEMFSDLLKFFRKAIAPAQSDGDISLKMTDSFPQQHLDYLRAIDHLLVVDKEDFDGSPKWKRLYKASHETEKDWYVARFEEQVKTMIGTQWQRSNRPVGQQALFQGKTPDQAYQWSYTVPQGFGVHILNERLKWSKERNLLPPLSREDLAIIAPKRRGVNSIRFKPTAGGKMKKLATWHIQKAYYDAFSIIQLAETGFKRAGHGIRLNEVEIVNAVGFSDKDKYKKRVIGSFVSPEPVSVIDYSKGMSLRDDKAKALEDKKIYRTYNQLKITGLDNALEKVNSYLTNALAAKAAETSVKMIIEQLNDMINASEK